MPNVKINSRQRKIENMSIDVYQRQPSDKFLIPIILTCSETVGQTCSNLVYACISWYRLLVENRVYHGDWELCVSESPISGRGKSRRFWYYILHENRLWDYPNMRLTLFNSPIYQTGLLKHKFRLNSYHTL